MKRWLYWAAGGLAVLAFYILGGPDRKAKKLRGQRDELVKDGSERSRAKAEKLNIKANKHQSNGYIASKVGREVVDNIGKNDESVSDILDSWRKPDGL